ncbi:glycosyltransferase family 2 protein [Bifidobacterium sp. 82T24]|uniref:glycosyltransferase family 2 protein n=1 Tax=Bifidobacterium pluvialisilvae TaxID=2834436 RepID=UPI001C571A11|nr:glycosyltransferase family 2 protein [Bifidobacterium pluvialisilvae]MBW3087889.1 glycosyltransferase family 2 protein [Bifidobacterium pluvialisilvae]
MQELVGDVLAECRMSPDQTVEPAVAAVVSVEEDTRYLSRTLQSLFSQSVMPATVIVADCTGGTQSAVTATLRAGAGAEEGGAHRSMTMRHVDVQVVNASGASSFGDSVGKALEQAHVTVRIRALWLLHDDSRPTGERCLESMLEAWRNASSASVLGCKQLDWDGDVLHDVGCYATTSHGIASLVVDGEPDQEQYDARQDVYMVDLAGALVSLPVWRSLDGTTPSLGGFAESADFCRRVNLSGGRVLVVPKSAIAHRRARFEGLRSSRGTSQEDERTSPYAAVIDGRERFRLTDIRVVAWPLMWLWRLLASFILFFRELVRKQPYQAVCELGAPWRLLAWMLPHGLSARRRVASQAKTSLRQLSVLVARRDQLAQWRERNEAFSRSRNARLLSPLEIMHLRAQRRRRAIWAAIMAAFAFIAGIAVNIDAWGSAITGGGFHSQTLVPSAASLRQIFESATSVYTYAVGLGTPAPPAPFLLVFLVLSVVTAGHAMATMALIVFGAAPLSALSFWALAGVFTRSNPVRVVSGLLWCSFGAVLGLYSQGNLPMLVVMAFLPAGLAFVFRSVGMYRTEDADEPTASAQQAAMAALCLAVSAAAEPQLILPLAVVFIAFLLLVRSHRVLLLMIPVPAMFMLAPTLLNIVFNLNAGSYRQLFADMMLPTAAVNGTVGSASLPSVLMHGFGLPYDGDVSSLYSAANIGTVLALASLLVLTVIAVVALFLPFALRVSRMMWAIVVAGAMTAMLAPRIAIAPGSSGNIAGTALPGLAFAMAGLLSCVCIVAGRAARPFSPLVSRPSEDGRSGLKAIAAANRRHYSRRRVVIVARAVLVMMLALCLALWGSVCGVRAGEGERLTAQRYEIPLIAQDFLASDANHRILALRAESPTSVEFSVLRTAQGDFIDGSPAMNAALLSTGMDETTRTMADASASLLQNNDDEAVKALARLGIGGIYVPYASDSARRSLVSNILASDGTQSVVSNESGTYVRLTADDAATRGIDDSGVRRALHNSWRMAWLWCLVIVVALYCIVAFPRMRRNEVKA